MPLAPFIPSISNNTGTTLVPDHGLPTYSTRVLCRPFKSYHLSMDSILRFGNVGFIMMTYMPVSRAFR